MVDKYCCETSWEATPSCEIKITDEEILDFLEEQDANTLDYIVFVSGKTIRDATIEQMKKENKIE